MPGGRGAGRRRTNRCRTQGVTIDQRAGSDRGCSRGRVRITIDAALVRRRHRDRTLRDAQHAIHIRDGVVAGRASAKNGCARCNGMSGSSVGSCGGCSRNSICHAADRIAINQTNVGARRGGESCHGWVNAAIGTASAAGGERQRPGTDCPVDGVARIH